MFDEISNVKVSSYSGGRGSIYGIKPVTYIRWRERSTGTKCQSLGARTATLRSGSAGEPPVNRAPVRNGRGEGPALQSVPNPSRPSACVMGGPPQSSGSHDPPRIGPIVAVEAERLPASKEVLCDDSRTDKSGVRVHHSLGPTVQWYGVNEAAELSR